jgi:hypothetical protein
MQLKNTYIAYSICFAIFFKLTFFNIVLFVLQNNFFNDIYTTNQIYKATRNRNRPYSIITAEGIAIKEEQAFIEKPETEDTQKLLGKFKLPFLSFFATYLASCKAQVKKSLHNFLNFFPSSEERLSISVLRL